MEQYSVVQQNHIPGIIQAHKRKGFHEWFDKETTEQKERPSGLIYGILRTSTGQIGDLQPAILRAPEAGDANEKPVVILEIANNGQEYLQGYEKEKEKEEVIKDTPTCTAFPFPREFQATRSVKRYTDYAVWPLLLMKQGDTQNEPIPVIIQPPLPTKNDKQYREYCGKVDFFHNRLQVFGKDRTHFRDTYI